jgi:hypothetical protein
MNATLLHVSIVAGVAAWSLLFWINWNWLQQGGHKRIFTVLAGVHLFRYIGLIALIPSMLNPVLFNFSHTYLQQVAYGDLIAMMLAGVAIVAVRQNWKTATFWA